MNLQKKLLLISSFLLLGLFILNFQGFGQEMVDDSLVGWWGFDNPAGLKDNSNYGNDAIVNKGGAWCWFADPRAIHHNGKTYVGWVDTKGNIRIWSYDHRMGRAENSVLHNGIKNRSGKLEIDDHDNPAILMLPDNHLMVFYSAHNGPAMYYRISTYPEDISSWNSEQAVTTDPPYTYPNPVYLSDENQIYLIYRGPGGTGIPTYRTSPDRITWSSPNPIFEVPDLFYDGSHKMRPYFKTVSNDKDEIHFAFTTGNPGEGPVINIYHAYYKNNAFYLPGGTKIKDVAQLPLTKEEASVVYDQATTGWKAWIWDIALKDGVPYIVYAVFPNMDNHLYRYAWWDDNNKTWVTHDIAYAGGTFETSGQQPYYSGGVVLDHEDPSVVYLSKEVNGVFEIQKWTTFNQGATWSVEDITSGSYKHNFRPVAIRNHSSDFSIAWVHGRYDHYTNYHTNIYSNKITAGASVVEGKLKNGFEFDGVDDYVEIEDSDSLDGMSELTVEAWIKKLPDSDFNEDTVVSKWNGVSVYAYLLRYDSQNDELDWYVNTQGGEVSAINSVNIEDNQWHHIAGVYDGETVLTYLDGIQLPNSAHTSENVGTNGLPVQIGSSPHNPNDRFSGYIDEVRIWKRALTPEEIKLCEENLPKIKVWDGELNWECDQITKKEGEASIKLNANIYTNAELYSPLIPVQPDQDYQVFYWAKTNNLLPGDAQVYGRVIPAQYNSQAGEEDDVNQNRIDPGWNMGENFGGTSDWVKKSYTFTTNPETSYVRLRAPMGLMGKAQGAVWFDEVRLEEALTPIINLSQGWNEIVWPEASAGKRASDIPVVCPIAASQESLWFRPYVKNYGGIDFNFENGKTYYLKCNQEVIWSP